MEKLTDIEIVYKVAEIQGQKLEMRGDPSIDNIWRVCGPMPYNPFHWALNCMLRDEYKVSINYNYGQAQIYIKHYLFCFTFEQSQHDICRAVLLVIIAAHGNGEKS